MDKLPDDKKTYSVTITNTTDNARFHNDSERRCIGVARSLLLPVDERISAIELRVPIFERGNNEKAHL